MDATKEFVMLVEKYGYLTLLKIYLVFIPYVSLS